MPKLISKKEDYHKYDVNLSNQARRNDFEGENDRGMLKNMEVAKRKKKIGEKCSCMAVYALFKFFWAI